MRELAGRLLAPLDSAVRLMLLDVLAVAAAEVTRELAPGSVELRLRAGEPEFVVTSPPGSHGPATAYGAEEGSHFDQERHPGGPAPAPTPAGAGAGEGVARVNLRLPEQLKSRVEQAADQEGLSINAWLVRAVTAALDRGQADARREQRSPRGGERYRGWAR